VFLMGVPVMLLLLVVGPMVLPETRNERAGRLDLASVTLSLAAILPVVYGITELARAGWAPLPAVAIAAGLVFAAMFVLRQRRLADPLLDPRLFGSRPFTGALVALLLAPAVVGGVGLYSNQFLQAVRGLPPFTAALWLLPSTLAGVVGALLASVLVRRIRPGYLIAASGALMALGGFLLTQLDSTSSLPAVALSLVPILLGFGPIGALGTALVVGSSPPEKAGAAAAMSETSSQLGVALGIAALGSIGTAVYSGQMADAVPPNLPAEAADAAQSTMPGALAVAQQLPAEFGATLADAARVAFTSGMNSAAGVVIGLGGVLVVLALALLRNARLGGEPAPAERPAADPVVEPVT
jgi:DHA2 family multidrug resistance protein-like MFS transporter